MTAHDIDRLAQAIAEGYIQRFKRCCATEKAMQCVYESACDVLVREENRKWVDGFNRMIVPVTEGPSKGGQNPPNTSSLRPPAPMGSGQKPDRPKTYTVTDGGW